MRYIFSVLFTLHTVDAHVSQPTVASDEKKRCKMTESYTDDREVEKKKKVKSMFRNRMKEKQRDIRGYFLCSLIEETFLEEPSEKLSFFSLRELTH